MSEASPIDVLQDGISMVHLESFSGGDNSVVRAARVSYGKTLTDPERDKKLIARLLNSDHGTPFEHNLFTFRIVAPIFVFRQWHRTRIGVSYNEISARYTEMKDKFYVPKVFRAQDTKDKQMSVEADLNHELAHQVVDLQARIAFDAYEKLLGMGVAREMARMVLPVNLYSEMYFTCNARSLMAFITLRSERHAQFETQLYSDAMAVALREKMPWTYEAFVSRLDPERYVGLSFPMKVTA